MGNQKGTGLWMPIPPARGCPSPSGKRIHEPRANGTHAGCHRMSHTTHVHYAPAGTPPLLGLRAWNGCEGGTHPSGAPTASGMAATQRRRLRQSIPRHLKFKNKAAQHRRADATSLSPHDTMSWCIMTASAQSSRAEWGRVKDGGEGAPSPPKPPSQTVLSFGWRRRRGRQFWA